MKSDREQNASSANSSTSGSTGGSSPSGSSQTGSSGGSQGSRYQRTINYLVAVALSSRETLEQDTLSPQYRAANWIANEDQFQLPLPDGLSGVADELADEVPIYTRFTERYALAVLYYATGGESWKYSMKFMEPIDHCEWYQDFITTSGSILRLGVSECKAFEDELVHGLELRT